MEDVPTEHAVLDSPGNRWRGLGHPSVPIVADSHQLALWPDDPSTENPEYLSRQLITCIGNKRSLLSHIGSAVDCVKQRLSKSQLRILDAFSGSGVVSRFFKAHASLLISNDIESYATVAGRCYLRNKSEVDLATVAEIVRDLNRRVEAEVMVPGFIEELYAPRDDTCITKEDRVFYTKSNARRLDNYRRLIETLPSGIKDMLLGPMLSPNPPKR